MMFALLRTFDDNMSVLPTLIYIAGWMTCCSAFATAQYMYVNIEVTRIVVVLVDCCHTSRFGTNGHLSDIVIR